MFQLFCNTVFSYMVLHPHLQSNISWLSCLKLHIKTSKQSVKHNLFLYNSILSDSKMYWMGMIDFYQTEMQTLVTVIQLCHNVRIR